MIFVIFFLFFHNITRKEKYYFRVVFTKWHVFKQGTIKWYIYLTVTEPDI